MYVDNSIDEPSFVRKNQDKDISKYNLTNVNSITLNTQAVYDNQVITKSYVDQIHQENERSKRDVGLGFYDESNDLVKNNQDIDFDNIKLTNLDSVTINRDPSADNELANKKYIDDQLDKITIVRLNQTLKIYLKGSVGKDTYSLSKYDKTPITDTTIIKAPNTGGYLLQQGKIKCNDKNNNGKIQNFI